jgi:hypothetical protein
MSERETFHENDIWFDDLIKSEPQYILPADFAERVALKAAKRSAWNHYFNEFIIYAAVITLLLITAVGIYLWNSSDWKLLLNRILSSVLLWGSILFLGIFILFADKVLLRYFLNRNKLTES